MFRDFSSFLSFFDKEQHPSSRKATSMILLSLSLPLLCLVSQSNELLPYKRIKEEEEKKKKRKKNRGTEMIRRCIERTFLLVCFLTAYYNGKRRCILLRVVIVFFFQTFFVFLVFHSCHRLSSLVVELNL
jgi:hypothetical protein